MRLDDEIVEWLAATLDSKRLHQFVPEMNGCFSAAVVRQQPFSVEVAVGRFGTYPIYCHKSEDSFVISDNFWEAAKHVEPKAYDFDAIASMILLGYVSGYRTLLRHITELEQASTHSFTITDGALHLEKNRYWRMEYKAKHGIDARTWQAELASTLESVFSRHAQAAQERSWRVFIPLSGGKDSRLIAALYRQNGTAVQAFSYGPSDNPETRIAHEVAEKLQIPLDVTAVDDPSVIDYRLIRLLTHRVGMCTRFTAGLGAQLSLKDHTPTNVFVPGHTGDLVTGGQIRRGALAVRSKGHALRYLLDSQLLPISDDTATAIFGQSWDDSLRENVLADSLTFDPDDPDGSIDRWDCENRQRRLILSELRTYETFGRWMLPFYDHELYDFYAAVPLHLRYLQRLYIDTLTRHVYTDELSHLAEIPLAGSGVMQSPSLAWRDRALLLDRFGALSEWILRRASISKKREHRCSVGRYSTEPSGPDPFDLWWHQYPSFPKRVFDLLESWDGMGGVINTEKLLYMLAQPQPRLFIQFVVPSLLTLRAFQEIVESPSDADTSSQRKRTQAG
jgi:hypothetical protein